MQTAPVFKQASISPGNKTVPAHLVLFRAGSLRGRVQQGFAGRGDRMGESQLQCQENKQNISVGL